MIAALMVYGVVATGLLLVAGLAVEVAMPVRLPRRFVWCGAVLLSCALTAAAGRDILGRDDSPATPAATPSPSIAASAERPLAEESPSFTESLEVAVASALRWPIAVAAGIGLNGSALLIAWGIVSASLLATGIGTATWNLRRRRRWNLVEMDGVSVRLSPATGPAVLGTLRPEIVVPGWLLSSSAEERRLALLHESEHLRARDGFLLTAGWATVVLLPWNLPLWWMVLRLRLAIEIDCDRRVLAAGVERKSYGSMLIDVSGHPPGFSFTAPALAGFPSALERRLIAMTARTTRYSWTRGGFGALLGGLAFLAACEAELPTAAEIEAMDASAIATRARQLGIDSTSYYINGERATAEEAGTLAAGAIRSVEVTREGRIGEAEAGSIRIYTRNEGTPTYVVDGEQVTADDFNALSPDDIANVSILKDASAAVDGFRAANGVLLVTTKAAAALESGPEPVAVDAQPTLGVRWSNGDSVVVQAGSAAQGAGPILDVEANGYSLSFGVQVDTLTRERTATPIRLHNMGDPLFVIDDVVASPDEFNRLNPSAIRSISVLKAADTSKYADPRAQNGVILVTTKAGGQ